MAAGMDELVHAGVATLVDDQKAALQAATRAEAKYLAFMSHDLRNTFNAMTLSLEVLKRRLHGRPEFAEDVREIGGVQQAVRDTVTGMERMLQAERLRSGAVALDVRPLDVHALVTDVAREYARRADAKGLTLSVQVDPTLTVRSDRELVRLILQNLVGNAVKYSDRGTVRIISACDAPPEATRHCVLTVSDEGPGIAPPQLSRLFDPFERGDTHGQPGVGLGLAIAHQAATVLGGTLTVESHLGAGSTFRLTLPRGA